VSKLCVNTVRAPRAAGPYSHAVRAGNLLFISGQLPIDPATGEIVRGGIEGQARRALENVGAILHSQGISFAEVVKVTVYLRDMDDAGLFNAVYGEYFPSGPPARACVEVSRLPSDSGVEIDAVALVD